MKIGEIVHKLTVFYEIVEVSGGVDHPQRVVELGGLVALIFDVQKKVLEIVIRNGEFIEKAVLLEDFHTEMEKSNVAKNFLIFENVEVPFIKVVHHFDSVVPNSGLDLNDAL